MGRESQAAEHPRKCMPDHIAGETYLADYLLYRLSLAPSRQCVAPFAKTLSRGIQHRSPRRPLVKHLVCDKADQTPL